MKVSGYFKFIFAFLVGLMLASSFAYARPVLAQEQLSLWGDPFAGEMIGFEAFKVIGLGNRDPRLIVTSVIQVALGFLGTLAVLLILYAGWLWMTADGDEGKIESARDLIKNAVIGLLIILSAFAIVTFILRALIMSTGAFGGNSNPTNPNRASSLSAVGAGIIGSVYPSPNQLEVPRNTSIIVSFKELIDPASICDKVVAGLCAPEARVLADSIKIFPTKAQDTLVEDVRVASSDNKTFVFSPRNYIGSPTEKIWYTVGLSTKIMKANKTKAFSISGFAWQFEVSNILDLTPPKILTTGVFPAPDSQQDQPGQITEPNFASAALLVNGNFKTARAWRVTYSKTNPNSVDLNILDPESNICDGQIDLAINYTNPPTANLAYRNMPGLVDQPEAPIVNRRIKTSCGFEIGLLKDTDNFSTGQSWNISLLTESKADSLIVGANVYTFVSNINGAKQILIGASQEATAANIVAALASNTDLVASSDPVNKAKINLKARTAGKIGNNISLLTTAVGDVLAITPFTGGTDRVVSVKVVGKSDKPRNAIIQINFDEAINPLSISGRSELLEKNIRVVNGTASVAGEWQIANQYKTVEFVPDLECGMNACGEKVYCLPGNADLHVELVAATLAANCANATECVAKTPFNECQQSLCYDKAASAFYPEGKLATGIVDLASNSLDGNRDTKAIGPQAFYSDNSGTGTGDKFTWSFWTSDVLDLTPPTIIDMTPAYNQVNIHVSDEIRVKFSKLMMMSSLKTGTAMIKKGDKQVEHALVNLRSLAKAPVGYWLSSSNEDSSIPADTESDQTITVINHSPLAGLNKYRIQVGSGVKDIYQNCYKPCAGPSCAVDSSNPSCCNGVPTDLSPAKICPDN